MTYDLIIIGSGPAGYVAAIRAGQTGLKTLIIDRKYVGGMCLNWGCIPTKSLLESAKMMKKVRSAHEFGIAGIQADQLSFDWPQALKRTNQVVAKLTRGIEYLWKKNGVEFLKAEAKILSATQVQADKRIFEAKNILIATGSRPASQELFEGSIDLEDLYSLKELPKAPLLYGRGGHLIELAQFFALIGSNPVIIAADLPLIPPLDEALESFIQRKLKKDKIPVLTVAESQIKKGMILSKGQEYPFDKVLNVSYRAAVLPPMDLELELDNGYIKTDRSHETSVKGIYAAGDVSGKSFVAHAASAQAMEVIEAIQGIAPPQEQRRYPINIYTDPELAQIGLTESQIKAQGIPYEVNQHPLTANAKALAEGSSEGFIRVLYETKYHQVLGVQIAAEHATDLISEAGILMELEGTSYDLARTIHAHPTVAEIYMDAGEVE
ncbi:MAG: FAD-dependent oxidoreductase [Candidatus Cloacimonadaceae bacterium]|jgi:dihydrolipoamide dehydrogenase|nr:FAD-dependent oxidoreductase [Candidatus Cloacimonadota bacterium]MDY0126655.1 FAD-dependent oxidoreductase [Candidatus Cloacimonadaceae bacterium]MCB5255549.1 FAD-dependent oxidoreductase [Candidatus Cloacimonadota bacterium]MCK9177377.1 FAD-dependent oxidoreductase [Candidatus Cloacimonadota bacterium]MCK9241816.1 FAD-dependent oxidoreductase [Candidatus Cloacimonadota bacterium]